MKGKGRASEEIEFLWDGYEYIVISEKTSP
jgi:hypothetical protein